MSCEKKECADSLESTIRKLRCAEERVKHYRKAALKLASGDVHKLHNALDATECEL